MAVERRVPKGIPETSGMRRESFPSVNLDKLYDFLCYSYILSIYDFTDNHIGGRNKFRLSFSQNSLAIVAIWTSSDVR